VPSSEGRIYRTETGFVIKDKDDEDWCKFIPFDDLDKIQTEVAIRTLEPARVAAMKTMPIPSLTRVSERHLKEYENEFEQICINDRQEAASRMQTETNDTKTIHVTSIVTEDDTPIEIPRSLLTQDEIFQSQFNLGIPTTHFHNRTQSDSTIRSPLSYQQTVLQDNPALTESFEKPQKLKQKSTTGSLYCSATSQFDSDEELDDESNEEDDDDLPSSIQQSPLENELYRSKTKTKSMTKTNSTYETNQPKERQEKQNEKTHQKETKPEKVEEEIPENDYQDLDHWTLFRTSMPENYIFNSIITIILFIILVIGTVLHFNSVLLMGFFSIWASYGKAAYHGTRVTISTYIDKFVQKQSRKFTNKTKTSSNTNSKNDIENLPRQHPLEGISIIKPEGIAGSMKKVKRKLKAEPIRVSEARVVKHTDHRNYLIVRFFNTITKYALLDPGSSCCLIHPDFLEELQKTSYIPIEESQFQIQGIVTGTKQEATKILNLRQDTN